MSSSYSFEIKRFSKDSFNDFKVNAIREVPLTIILNNREVVTLLCTAKEPRLLAIGFLKSDAFLNKPEDITGLQITNKPDCILVEVTTDHDPWQGRTIQRSITSGCGKGTNFNRNMQTISRRTINSELQVTPKQVIELTRELHSRSKLYGKTRGCHNSSLCSPEEMLVFHEDIGRHNAIDMICGHCFLNNISVNDKIIVTTGRVTSEILLKIVRIGVPVIISTAVATSMAVDLAQKTGVTLIGDTGDEGFRVYNSAGRISGL